MRTDHSLAQRRHDPRRIRPPGLSAGFALACLCVPSGWALEPRDYAVDAWVQAQATPPAINLSWPSRAELARQYVIRRKPAGSGNWGGPLAVLPGSATGYWDGNVAVGSAYEYEIQMETSTADGSGGWVNAFTYLYAGIQAPLVEAKGKVILIVDSTVAPAIVSELAVFQQDLAGSGWQVVRRDVARDASVPEVKNRIVSEYNADPARVRSVVLIGHVPVPYSGAIAPDMHPSHQGAWPADVFYADLDGTWTDTTVSIVCEDSQDNDNFPGDGKFDQSQIPSSVELEIGRIDFWNLPAFAPRSEIDLLRAYFRKNHQFRHRSFASARLGLVRDNFGDLGGDAPAVDAWRHFGPFFGPNSAREVPAGAFFPTLNNESFLWAYGCGGGGYFKADGVGSTSDFAANDPKAVFLILHGSYFGDWNNADNFLRAAIATPSRALASVWSGLPHWFLHHLALGGTIGFSARLTQNNRGTYKSHRNFSAGEVHISLLGDPTLELFPVMPPSNLAGSASPGGVNLSWSASTDENLAGYHVYYSSQSSLGPFQRLTPAPISGTAFNHAVGAGTHYYMVRAVKLEQTGSGSFFNASQGIFASLTKTSGGGGALPVVSVAAEDGDVSEQGANAGSFRITRSITTADPLTVEFILGGTAVNGVDYAELSQNVTIPPGGNSAIVGVLPIFDNAVEGNETVTLQIRSNPNYAVGTPYSGMLVIQDYVPNQPPTLSPIPDQTIRVGGSTGEIPFTVGDTETPAANLALRGGSSNASLVPLGGIRFGGSGVNRTVRVTPAAGVAGSATISITVSDGTDEASQSFTLAVIRANSPPIAHSRTVEVIEDSSTAVSLSGSDPDGDSLSFHLLELPTRGEIQGTPPNLRYVPARDQFGVDTFSFWVSDGTLASSPATITIEIVPRNDPPSIGEIAAQTIWRNGTLGPLEIRVSDIDHPAAELTVAALSSNPGVVPASGIQIEGDGNSRAAWITPAADATGSTLITLRVSDGMAFAETIFQVQVIPAPKILTLEFQNDGSVRLRVEGWIESRFVVEASADARTWTKIGEGTSDANGGAEFVDPAAQGARARFYRMAWR